MMRRLYDWMMRMAGHRRAPHALAFISFLESSIFPIPPDAMLIPMALADRAKAWRYAAICTVASVVGGIAGYMIGYFLLDLVREFACQTPASASFVLIDASRKALGFICPGGKFQQALDWFNDWGVWILLIKGPTPFPFKILTIAAGAAHMNLLAFTIASVLSRALRFYLVAGLIYWYGEPIREFIERRLNLIVTVLTVAVVATLVGLRYLL